jgi:hypothetical protein
VELPMNLPCLAASTAFAIGITLATAAARADDPTAVPPYGGTEAAPAPSPDIAVGGASRSNPPERGFLYAVEPSVPDPWHAVVGMGVGNIARTGEQRPVGAAESFPTLGVEVGILSRLSLYAEGGYVFIQDGNPAGLASPFLADMGAHILLTDPGSRMWRLSLRPSVNYDVDGSWTGNLAATLGWYYRQVRVVASYMGSHTFQDGSDPVDMQATLGATYALPYGFRVGVEGVATDLEELFQAGAEGGASAFAGPTVGWEWGRVQLVAGPAWGVTPSSPTTDVVEYRWAMAVRL